VNNGAIYDRAGPQSFFGGEPTGNPRIAGLFLRPDSVGQETCETFLHGIWSEHHPICTIKKDFTIEAGSSLTIDSEVTLWIVQFATLSNKGTIYNEGRITNEFVIINNINAVINNTGTIFSGSTASGETAKIRNHGTIENFDTIVNYGKIDPIGFINNHCGGVYLGIPRGEIIDIPCIGSRKK
jgi:hypothetical protein